MHLIARVQQQHIQDRRFVCAHMLTISPCMAAQVAGVISFVWVDWRIKHIDMCRTKLTVPQNIWRPCVNHIQYMSKVRAAGVTVHNFERAELQLERDFKLVEDADNHSRDSRRLKAFPFDSLRFNFSEVMSDEVSMHTSEVRERVGRAAVPL